MSMHACISTVLENSQDAFPSGISSLPAFPWRAPLERYGGSSCSVFQGSMCSPLVFLSNCDESGFMKAHFSCVLYFNVIDFFFP